MEIRGLKVNRRKPECIGLPCYMFVPDNGVKGKVHVAVRPAMFYGLETVTLTEIQEAKM